VDSALIREKILAHPLTTLCYIVEDGPLITAVAHVAGRRFACAGKTEGKAMQALREKLRAWAKEEGHGSKS